MDNLMTNTNTPTLSQAQAGQIVRQFATCNPNFSFKADYIDGMAVMFRIGRNSKKWMHKVRIELNSADLYNVRMYRINNDIYSQNFGDVEYIDLSDDGYGGWYGDMLNIQDEYQNRHKLNWTLRTPKPEIEIDMANIANIFVIASVAQELNK
jgi:hypothetical protein